MPADEPLFIALTVDVDPDANRAVPGRPDAITAGAAEPRLAACLPGLDSLAGMLTDLRLPAVLFWEGRTLEDLAVRDHGLLDRIRDNPRLEHACHGYQHEDFAGDDSGLPLDRTACRTILQRARQSCASVLGLRPTGFRAPYCRTTPELLGALEELGFTYDASQTREVSGKWALRPYRLEGHQLWELALPRTRDRAGEALTGYLWQLFEGNRPVQDYTDLVDRAREHPGGLLQIALHPWHLVVSAHNEPLAERNIDAVALLRQLLAELAGAGGLRFITLEGYLHRSVK